MKRLVFGMRTSSGEVLYMRGAKQMEEKKVWMCGSGREGTINRG